MNNHLVVANDATFEKEVLQSPLPVLVDFWAPWCGPCRFVGPVVEELAGEYAGKCKVVKVNVDDAQQLAAGYRIRGVPTLMVFKDGKTVETFVGAPPAAALRAKLDAVATSPKRACACACSA